MSNEIMAALIGVAGSTLLMFAGGAITSLRSSGKNEDRLNAHQTRLDDHDLVIKALPERYVPRTELTGILEALRESQGRTEDWVRFLVKKEAVPPEPK